jgi:hypothetical protein
VPPALMTVFDALPPWDMISVPPAEMMVPEP